MKVLVTGARGLLGSEFVRAVQGRGDTVVGLGRKELDVTDAGRVRDVALAASPDAIIHCAAYTAVDAAENASDEAMRVNRDGARNVAKAASETEARVVYISTDYVFGGTASRPHRPDDAVDPQSVYARSKWLGEEAVAEETGGQALIVRTGWLYGAGGKNFVDSMIRHGRGGGPLRVVDDQIGRPTWARNVANVVLELLEAKVAGVWHVADGGTASWLQLAATAFELVGLETPVSSVSTEEWGAAAPRPPYSVLQLDRTEAVVGHVMQPWELALGEYLTGRGAMLADAGAPA